MRFSFCLALLLSDLSSSFQPVFVQRLPLTLHQASNSFDEFEFLYRETADAAHSSITNHRRVQVNFGENSKAKAVLVSSLTAPATTSVEEELKETPEDNQVSGDAEDVEDLFARRKAIMMYEEQREASRFENRLQNLDFQGVVLTLVIPSIIAFAGGRWTYNRISAKVNEKLEASLESFANELVYHDGDFEEMRMCVADYNKKLVLLGPLKRNKMISKYLQTFAKRKVVSPQAISSLSYAFSLFKLDEETAAKLIVSVCEDMGSKKLSSVAKLLFLGNRIFKSSQAKKALLPIKEILKSTYRDPVLADELVESSQLAIGEAAYRTAVLAAGKNQKKLSPGWEVLGLKKEDAQRIWNEAAEEGFLTDREALYKVKKVKYDRNGNRIDDEGNLLDPDNAIKSDENETVAGAFECTECGFTLFVASGRESKFYGPSFKCPECGAPKSKFTAREE